MTASLYQSGSSLKGRLGGRAPAACGSVGLMTASRMVALEVEGGARCLQVIVEVALAADAAADAQNMSRGICRVQRHVIASALPQEARPGEQVVGLEGRGGIAAVARTRRQQAVGRHPARLGVVRVEIDDDEHTLGAIEAALAVRDEGPIVDVMEAQSGIALQRRVVAADAIDQCDEVAQAVGPSALPETH